MPRAGSLLLVEDDRVLADALARGLQAENFEVTLVHDGADGLSLAGDRHFDAIVLDLMLPGLNGFRFCRLLRQREDFTPVLVLTAKEGEWDEAEEAVFVRGVAGPSSGPVAPSHPGPQSDAGRRRPQA
jgi:DNA-binding response OmpR family regulator